MQHSFHISVITIERYLASTLQCLV